MYILGFIMLLHLNRMVDIQTEHTCLSSRFFSDHFPHSTHTNGIVVRPEQGRASTSPPPFRLLPRLLSSLVGQSPVALLGNGQLHTLALRQRDVRLGALADDEHVRQAGREHVPGRILHVHDLERSRVLLAQDHRTATAQISSARDHAQVARFELEHVQHLAGGDVVLDRVVLVDLRIRIADGAAVVRQQERHALRSDLDALHLQQLVLGLLARDAVHREAALDVVDQAEVFAGLVDVDHIWKGVVKA